MLNHYSKAVHLIWPSLSPILARFENCRSALWCKAAPTEGTVVKASNRCSWEKTWCPLGWIKGGRLNTGDRWGGTSCGFCARDDASRAVAARAAQRKTFAFDVHMRPICNRQDFSDCDGHLTVPQNYLGRLHRGDAKCRSSSPSGWLLCPVNQHFSQR